MTISLGADPEFFVERRDKPGIIPCVGILPGSKNTPHAIANSKVGTVIHEDNVAVEIGFTPAAHGGDFSARLGLALGEMKDFLRSHNLQIVEGQSHAFNVNDLQTPQARNFGCAPDNNAYDGGRVRVGPPTSIIGGRVRFAGGHVHIGGDFNCPPFVAALFADIFLGVAPIQCGYNVGGVDKYRRNWYGKPGIFRPKDYGIEYRSIGNWWLFSKNAREFITWQAERLAHYLENTSATKLREQLGAVNWASVQNMLTYQFIDDDHAYDMAGKTTAMLKKSGVKGFC